MISSRILVHVRDLSSLQIFVDKFIGWKRILSTIKDAAAVIVRDWNLEGKLLSEEGVDGVKEGFEGGGEPV